MLKDFYNTMKHQYLKNSQFHHLSCIIILKLSNAWTHLMITKDKHNFNQEISTIYLNGKLSEAYKDKESSQ